ncbi:unnamed protein product [Protopolystoma xenopodis]|uniref:Uncharacterized protein n=1 Tax=Protopolystoma xenopodis TaxID=117903 RepID=A0A448WF76_9PLAT|nr:unnamed protein product [Protopolystoma xenopodis]
MPFVSDVGGGHLLGQASYGLFRCFIVPHALPTGQVFVFVNQTTWLDWRNLRGFDHPPQSSGQYCSPNNRLGSLARTSSAEGSGLSVADARNRSVQTPLELPKLDQPDRLRKCAVPDLDPASRRGRGVGQEGEERVKMQKKQAHYGSGIGPTDRRSHVNTCCLSLDHGNHDCLSAAGTGGSHAHLSECQRLVKQWQT